MTLSFKTQIGGKPTEFVEKIWLGLIFKTNTVIEYGEISFIQQSADRGLLWHPWNAFKPKFHTIREDKPNRWKEGNKIHFVINNRTKERFQFAPVIPVKRIQQIDIDNLFAEQKLVSIDGRALTQNEIETLAYNDGFDCVDDFWDFFNGILFSGKIIHWTDLKY